MDPDLLIREYEDHLRAVERVAELTRRTYLLEIDALKKWCETAECVLPDLRPVDLVAYLSYRQINGADARTVAKAVSALRSFYGFLVVDEYRRDNPALMIDVPKKSLPLPEVLDRSEVERFFEYIGSDSHYDIRDRTLFEVIYSCGLRISEVADLRLSNLHLEERLIRVHGKGGRERVVPIGEHATERLQHYLKEVRPRLTKPGKRSDSSGCRRYLIWQIFILFVRRSVTASGTRFSMQRSTSGETRSHYSSVIL